MKEGLREWRDNGGLAFCSLLGAVVSVGHIFSLGVFMPLIESDTGWSRSEVTSSLLVTSVVGALFSPVVGRFVDRGYARRSVLGGALLYSLSLIALGLIPVSLIAWYCTWVLLAVGGAFFNLTVWTALISARFASNRGLSLAIIMCGTGIAAIIYPPAASKLTAAFTWRQAYMALGFLSALLLLPFFIWVHKPAITSPSASLASVALAAKPLAGPSPFTTASFFMLASVALLLTMVVSGMNVHFVPVLVSLGAGGRQAADAAGMIGIGTIVTRLIVGAVVDRVDARLIGIPASLAPAGSLFLIWKFGGSYPLGEGAAAILLGAGLGAEGLLLAFMAGKIFGTARIGVVWGALMSLMLIAAGVGPLFAAGVFDRWHDYTLFFYGAAALSILSAVIIANLRPSPRTNGRS